MGKGLVEHNEHLTINDADITNRLTNSSNHKLINSSTHTKETKKSEALKTSLLRLFMFI